MEHICDSLKVMGFQTGGAAQEFFAVDAARVLKLPAGISLEQGAMIEPISVATHAIRRGGSVVGKNVMVIGAGPIGNLVAQVARAQGAACVIITDLSDYRLDLARQVGLSAVVNPARENLDEVILQNFGQDRADIIFECIGVQATISQAISVARKGSPIVVVGVFGKKPEVDVGLVQDRELILIGTLMYQKQDYETAISLVEQGLVQLDKLITHRFPFADYLNAYRTIEKAEGRTMKVLVTLD
jgi:L-iditol 2-dehydrogenase